MSVFQPAVLVALAGYTKSLKSNLAQALSERYGFFHVELSDALISHLKEISAPITLENLVKATHELRTTQGIDILARLASKRVHQSRSPRVVVAGLRSYADHKYFKSHYSNYWVVFVHSPALLRHERLRNDESVKVKTDEAFKALDQHHEIEGIIKVANESDYLVIENCGFPIPLYTQLFNFVYRRLLRFGPDSAPVLKKVSNQR